MVVLPSFMSLPPEILTEIALWLNGPDNRTLRLVCHRIASIVEPLCLKEVFIDINSTKWGDTVERLKALATRSADSVNYIEIVNILNSDSYGRSNATHDQGEKEISFSSQVFNALMEIKNVTTLCWATNALDSPLVQASIIDFVGRRRVATLNLDFGKGCLARLPFRILAVEDLEEFHVKNIFLLPSETSSYMILVISRIIHNSPNLTCLKIDTGYFEATLQSPSLHRLLSAEIERRPMSLKHLSLRNVRTLLDEDTLPHLRSLESLSIHFNLTTELHGSHLHDIWNTLRTEAIHLSRIDVNLTEVDDALLDYILSYDGVRELVFDNSARLWSGPEINSIATRFFKDVLPKVASTLKVLHLETVCGGAWCFGPNNASSISQCRNLERLTVSIVDLGQSHSKETMTLLDEVLSKLPRLYYLKKIDVPTVPQIA